METSPRSRWGAVRWAGLLAGPVLALAVYALLPGRYLDPGRGELVEFSAAGRATLAAMTWMGVWWLTEAIDIAATALLPVALFPLLGIASIEQAAAPYASSVIFLFLGGFLIALSMQRWGLDRRLALLTVRAVGTRPAQMIGGFMLATAALSAFVSNTATTALMLPIALSVIALVERPGKVGSTETSLRAGASRDEAADRADGGGFEPTPRAEAGGTRGTGYAPSAGADGGAISADGGRMPAERADHGEATGAPAPASEPPGGRHFPTALMLAVAYAASIGGLATLVGTPPNLFLAGFLRESRGTELSFVGWLRVGVPLTVVLLPLTWWLLTRWVYPVDRRPIPGAREMIRAALAGLGRPNRGERVTLWVFVLTAAAWITRPLLAGLELGGGRPFAALGDAGFAMIAALALFVIPVDLRERTFTMDWETARRLPWGVLVLFGGGLSLAAAVSANGVAEFLGAQVGAFGGWPELAIVLLVTTATIFLTELTSNTATAATLVPILAALAPGLDVPVLRLVVPATLAASCAFMLPVATPPNALVFGSGRVTIPQMARAGWWLNLIAIALITLLAYSGLLAM